MKAIFLDFDGVLNRHVAFPNGYCGIEPECVKYLCSILKNIPDAKIVVSSAWRYMMHSGDISERGMEYLLCIHGAPFEIINNRIHGKTQTDEETCEQIGILEPGGILDYKWLKENGQEVRVIQIEQYAEQHNIEEYIVIDDLPLPTTKLIQTIPTVGICPKIAETAINKLNNPFVINLKENNMEIKVNSIKSVILEEIQQMEKQKITLCNYIPPRPTKMWRTDIKAMCKINQDYTKITMYMGIKNNEDFYDRLKEAIQYFITIGAPFKPEANKIQIKYKTFEEGIMVDENFKIFFDTIEEDGAVLKIEIFAQRN